MSKRNTKKNAPIVTPIAGVVNYAEAAAKMATAQTTASEGTAKANDEHAAALVKVSVSKAATIFAACQYLPVGMDGDAFDANLRPLLKTAIAKAIGEPEKSIKVNGPITYIKTVVLAFSNGLVLDESVAANFQTYANKTCKDHLIAKGVKGVNPNGAGRTAGTTGIDAKVQPLTQKQIKARESLSNACRVIANFDCGDVLPANIAARAKGLQTLVQYGNKLLWTDLDKLIAKAIEMKLGEATKAD